MHPSRWPRLRRWTDSENTEFLTSAQTAASPLPNNSLKHGLSAETMVVPGEDAAEFAAFLDPVRDLCQPRDVIEESIVREVRHG